MSDKAIQTPVAEHKDEIAALINTLDRQDWAKAASVASVTRPVEKDSIITLPAELPRAKGDPTAQSVVVVDESAHRTHVLQMQEGKLTDVVTVADAVGKHSTPTPMKRWEVSDKRLDPTWYPPKDIGGHPIGPYKFNHHNPIGLAFIRLDGTGYGMHGTNRPDEIGKSVSHGCIRHNNQDILKVYPFVEKGTAVYTVKHFDGARIRLSDFEKKN